MNRAKLWLVGLAVAIAVLVTSRIDAHNAGKLEEKNRVLDSTLTADRRALHDSLTKLRRDSVVTAQALQAAAAARMVAAAQKARADSLAKRVKVLSDSMVAVDGGEPVPVPRPVIVELLQLRQTVVDQAIALTADTVAIHALEVQLVTASGAIAAGTKLSGHQDDKVATLESARPNWLHRLGGALVTAGTAAGCGAIGAVIAGPAGAAIGAAACVFAAR